jgi:D-alanine transaminase
MKKYLEQEKKMAELAYLNGKIMPIEKAFVPIEDRGYQFGDAVYEYIASHDGKMFFVDDHLARLKRSMQELSFPEISSTMIKKAVIDLFNASQITRAGIYIQISRAVDLRSHAFSNKEPVQIVMTVRNLPERHIHAIKGASAITTEDYRWARCDIKTVQLLPNTLSKQKAIDKGAYDTIFISKDKIVREATSSNVFIIKNDIVFTHPLTHNILPGITRKIILEICRDKGIAFEEIFFNLEKLYDADEVFLSGTTTEVLPIISIDNKTIADKKPGPVTKNLYRELRLKAGVKQDI